MEATEKISTISKQFEDQLQEKRLEIMQLETRAGQLEQELAVQKDLTSRYIDELSRTRMSLNAQIDKLANVRVDQIAIEVKKLLKI